MEFGSDFHALSFGDTRSSKGIPSRCNSTLFASGRMAIQSLILQHSWHRIWVPQYFCHEVLAAIEATGIELAFYPDYPNADDFSAISQIGFEPNDVVLRMNFFGLRSLRDNNAIPVTVIEDHSHGINTPWALNSNADYCFASLRKTMPIPEGGIVWSPFGLELPEQLPSNADNDALTLKRYYAMFRKLMYLQGFDPDKEAFRRLFAETEETLCDLVLCGMSELNHILYSTIDSKRFDKKKKENWRHLSELLEQKVNFMKPESENCLPFSMVILCDSPAHRERFKRNLILHNVYPATLWPIPDRKWLKEMPVLLSIHCDARYGSEDIEKLANIIYHAY